MGMFPNLGGISSRKSPVRGFWPGTSSLVAVLRVEGMPRGGRAETNEGKYRPGCVS